MSRPDFADYEDERGLFRGLLSDPCERRILLVKGGHDMGKTSLVGVCLEEAQDDDAILCPVDFESAAMNPAEILSAIGRNVGTDKLPRYQSLETGPESQPLIVRIILQLGFRQIVNINHGARDDLDAQLAGRTVLIGEPDKGADVLRDTGWEWQHPPESAFGRVDDLARLTHEHAEAGRLEPRGLGWTLLWKGYVGIIYSRYDWAKATLEAIDVSRDMDEDLAVHRTMYLGEADYRLERYGSSRELYEEAVAIYREIGDRIGEANCIHSLGELDSLLDEHDSAWERFVLALTIYRDIGEATGEANCIHSLGELDDELGRHESARERYETALAIYRKIGNGFGESNVLSSLEELDRTHRR